jgi:hypothetical protein
MGLTKVYTIWEFDEKTDDWTRWSMPKTYWASKKEAEDFLLEYWKDLDLGQEDYKMDNFLIEEDFV